MKIISLIICLIFTLNSYASICTAQLSICFTPTENCTDQIIKVIKEARKQIYIQAYSFTSLPIAKAVIEAKRKGVVVNVILDKNKVNQKQSVVTLFNNQKIPLWIDSKVGKAHNKIIITESKVITGSFNFKTSSQTRNAENVVIATSKCMVEEYMKNWQLRKKESLTYKQYMNNKNNN